MKTMTKTLIVGGLVGAVGITAIVGTGYARGWGGRHAGYGAVRMLEQFDTDGDSRLTQIEIDDARNAHFATYDADGDGALSLDEFRGLFQTVSEPMVVIAFQMLDPDGDASVSSDEMDRRFGDLVERHDHDGDGALSTKDMHRGRHGKREHREDD
jgi:hypothetical protein